MVGVYCFVAFEYIFLYDRRERNIILKILEFLLYCLTCIIFLEE